MVLKEKLISILSLLESAFGFKLISIPKGDYTQEQILEKGSVELFSQALFHKYILAFEFISLLLLVAAVGAFVLGKKTFQKTSEE